MITTRKKIVKDKGCSMNRGLPSAHGHAAMGGFGCPDCVSLARLDEANLLENVVTRYNRDEIYTYISHVLLAVNPYKNLPSLYGPDVMAQYQMPPQPGIRPPPHPYEVAQVCLRGLHRGEQQAIVISGESGAGKTETAKTILRYLEACSGKHPASIESRVLAMSRVLESFGHASTSRNENSSRFGKYLMLRSGSHGLDVQVKTYLLEASRVVSRAPDERSFHIFYEMLSGISQEACSALGLQPGQQHALLRGTSRRDGSHTRDAENYAELWAALTTLNLGDAVKGIMEVLAGILHLGDVLLPPTRSGSINEFDEQRLHEASRLLGIDLDDLRATLRQRSVGVKGRKSVYKVDRNREQMQCVVRSLIVTLYSNLFRWLNDQMNRSLHANLPTSICKLGLLDIYGFESLSRNSLEQLLINLTNERLQLLFIDAVLIAEQRTYLQEGLRYHEVQVDISSNSTQAVSVFLDVLDDWGRQRCRGLAVTDSQCCEAGIHAIQPQGAAGAKKRVPLLRAANPRRGHSIVQAGAFIVSHYAGEVQYAAEGWLDGNDAQPLPEIVDLLSESTNDLVRNLAPIADQSRSTLGRQFQSVSRTYRRDLDGLLSTLRSSRLHFIRCFRPNALQAAGQVDRRYLLEQLLHCGTLKLLQVMHQGYPHRLPLNEVALRFAPLLPARLQRSSRRTIVQTLLLAYGVPSGEWALGLTQLFLKAGQLSVLEELCNCGAPPDPRALEVASRAIIRGRWRRAVTALTFAAWLPRFVHAKKKRRAMVRQRFRAVVHVLLAARRLRLLGRAAAERKAALRRRFRRAVLGIVFLLRLKQAAAYSAASHRKAVQHQDLGSFASRVLSRSQAQKDHRHPGARMPSSEEKLSSSKWFAAVPGLQSRHAHDSQGDRSDDAEESDQEQKKEVVKDADSFWRVNIEAVYRRKNPKLLEKVPALISKYKDKGQALSLLYAKVCKTYEMDPKVLWATKSQEEEDDGDDDGESFKDNAYEPGEEKPSTSSSSKASKGGFFNFGAVANKFGSSSSASSIFGAAVAQSKRASSGGSGGGLFGASGLFSAPAEASSGVRRLFPLNRAFDVCLVAKVHQEDMKPRPPQKRPRQGMCARRASNKENEDYWLEQPMKRRRL